MGYRPWGCRESDTTERLHFLSFFLSLYPRWEVGTGQVRAGTSQGSQDPLSTHVASNVVVTQWCPTLWDPMDCSPPSSSVHGILQVRILEWVAFSFSRRSRTKDRTRVSCIAGTFFTI